jgi:hypothetical protein
MWRCVDLVWAYVSEELIASIFKVENLLARNKRQQVADVTIKICISYLNYNYMWFISKKLQGNSTLATSSVNGFATRTIFLPSKGLAPNPRVVPSVWNINWLSF